MFNKKAISPLIATILLIAFAVSIGALIMNWSSNNAISKPIECSSINLVATGCIDSNKILLNFINKDSVDITGIILKQDTDKNLVYEYNMPTNIANNVQKQIVFPVNMSSKAIIIPIISTESDKVMCESKKIILSLKNC